jgi:copper(I)-binding protein
LRVGDRVPLTLSFEKGGTIDVVANVETASGTDPGKGEASRAR